MNILDVNYSLLGPNTFNMLVYLRIVDYPTTFDREIACAIYCF